MLDEARASALRDDYAAERLDLRDLPFVTIDPPGSKDLDQAVHLSRSGAGGYVVDYAIADVGRIVQAGGAVDTEAQLRGVTFYAPDGRTPLHPPVLSEDSASLLPGVDRAAAAWRIEPRRARRDPRRHRPAGAGPVPRTADLHRGAGRPRRRDRR